MCIINMVLLFIEKYRICVLIAIIKQYYEIQGTNKICRKPLHNNKIKVHIYVFQNNQLHVYGNNIDRSSLLQVFYLRKIVKYQESYGKVELKMFHFRLGQSFHEAISKVLYIFLFVSIYCSAHSYIQIYSSCSCNAKC